MAMDSVGAVGYPESPCSEVIQVIDLVAQGRRISERRSLLGRSQRDLARTAHLSQATLSRIENGERPARMDEVLRIARALGTSLESLVAEVPFEGRVQFAHRISSTDVDASAVRARVAQLLEIDAFLTTRGAPEVA